MFSNTSPATEIASQPQLLGHRARLQRELALAFSEQPPSHALIKRIVDDLAGIEHALAGDDWHRSHEQAVRRHWRRLLPRRTVGFPISTSSLSIRRPVRLFYPAH